MNRKCPNQVKRMLADRRSRALFDGFRAQWLGVGTLKEKLFDPKKFPQMTPTMRTAMYDEARLFFDSIVQENRGVLCFVDSDYTFLNGTLAPLYGLEKTVTGPEMRRVETHGQQPRWRPWHTWGVGGDLVPGTNEPREAWRGCSSRFSGSTFLRRPRTSRPPEKQNQKQVANLTLRQRTELHRKNPTCANCHKVLDPIGFGLENFDAIGRWRDKDDSGGPIDAAGELPGGKRFSSPKELKVIIAGRKAELARNLTEKLLAYALCRQLEGYDEIVVDRMMENLAREDYRMQSLILEIVTSYPFLNRQVSTSNAK
ncbi:MAG: DUF1592 domain-containing protein [Gemmataceae bacterium]